MNERKWWWWWWQMTDNSTRSKDKSVNAKKFKIWSLQFLRFKAVTLLIRSCVHLLKLCHWQKYILLTFFGKKGQPKPKRGSLPADARETQHPESLNRAIFKSGKKEGTSLFESSLLRAPSTFIYNHFATQYIFVCFILNLWRALSFLSAP